MGQFLLLITNIECSVYHQKPISLNAQKTSLLQKLEKNASVVLKIIQFGVLEIQFAQLAAWDSIIIRMVIIVAQEMSKKNSP